MDEEAPPHLRPETRRWWRTIVETHKLAEPKIRMLTLAAEALDRCEQARQVIAVEGLTVKTRDGSQKTHPACRIERDARLAFARTWRALALDNGRPAIDATLKPWRPHIPQDE